MNSLDKNVFIDYTKEFDQKFKSDMKSLNVLPPFTVIHAGARVPQIVEFISKIIHDGYSSM